MANDLARRTWPWMTAAVLLVAGFMYWLYAESSRIEQEVAVADTAAGPGPPAVPDSVFAQAPDQFSRRRILLTSVTVDESLGRAAFTLQLPGEPGYPAILDRPLVEQGMQLTRGDQVDISGSVFALNDSILTVWAQRGVFNVENREKLSGRTTFFLVDSLDFVIPGAEEGGEVGEGSEAREAQATAPR